MSFLFLISIWHSLRGWGNLSNVAQISGKKEEFSPSSGILPVLANRDVLCGCRWELQLRNKHLPWLQPVFGSPSLEYVIHSHHNNINLLAEHTELFYPRRETSTSFRALFVPALPAPASDRYSSGTELSWAPFPAPALPHFSWNTNSSVVPPQQLCSCQLWHLAASRQPLALSSDLLNCHFSFSTISTIHLLERRLPYEVLLK